MKMKYNLSDIHKLKKILTGRHSLKEMLKEILQTEGKWKQRDLDLCKGMKRTETEATRVNIFYFSNYFR